MFTRFGGVTDANVKGKIARGERIRAILSQPQYAPLRLADEVALLLALHAGLLDPLGLDGLAAFRAELPARLDGAAGQIVDGIEATGSLDAGQRHRLMTVLTELAARFAEPPKPGTG